MLARLHVHHRSEHFQFETRCDSNHTDCCFVEKPRFFPLTPGRAALRRRLAFYLFQRQNAPSPPDSNLRKYASPCRKSAFLILRQQGHGATIPRQRSAIPAKRNLRRSPTCGNNIFPVSAPPDLIAKVPASQRLPQTCCLRERQLSRKAALPAQGKFFRPPHRYFQDYAAPCPATKEKQWIRLVTKFSAGNFHAFTTFYERESALT